MGEIDVEVAKRMYRCKSQQLSWYYGREVLTFFMPECPLVAYSWDDHACNAMMFRNGIDEKDGTAAPLPGYSSEPDAIREVLDWVHDQGGTVEIAILAKEVRSRVTNRDGVSDQEILVLESFGMFEQVAQSVCKAFINVYPELEPVP